MQLIVDEYVAYIRNKPVSHVRISRYIGIISTYVCLYIFHYSRKYQCYAGTSMPITLFSTTAYFNKRNVKFLKLGTNDANMMIPQRYCFPRYNISLLFQPKRNRKKELNLWCEIKNVYLTPTFNKYPLYQQLLKYENDKCLTNPAFIPIS